MSLRGKFLKIHQPASLCMRARFREKPPLDSINVDNLALWSVVPVKLGNILNAQLHSSDYSSSDTSTTNAAVVV